MLTGVWFLHFLGLFLWTLYKKCTHNPISLAFKKSQIDLPKTDLQKTSTSQVVLQTEQSPVEYQEPPAWMRKAHDPPNDYQTNEQIELHIQEMETQKQGQEQVDSKERQEAQNQGEQQQEQKGQLGQQQQQDYLDDQQHQPKTKVMEM